VADRGEAFDRPGLKQDRSRQRLADVSNRYVACFPIFS
jgi:hypothetical protein